MKPFHVYLRLGLVAAGISAGATAGAQTLVALPDPSLEANGFFTVAGGESAMTSLLSQPNPPTAVFAMSDDMAFGAIRALQRHGIRPGADIAIASIDGHELAELLDLTTVGQPVAQMGRMAADALLGRMLGREATAPEEMTVPTTLVVRGSTVPVDRAAATS